MSTLADLKALAEAAIDNAAECPDCDDNRWDLDDVATPEVIKALVAVAEAAQVVFPPDFEPEAQPEVWRRYNEMWVALDALDAVLA